MTTELTTKAQVSPSAETRTPQGQPREQTGHTPGPWRIFGPYAVVEKPGIVDVGDANGQHIAGHVSEANARLIAATPELLEACEACLPAMQQDCLRTEQKEQLWKQLRLAIIKARGLSPDGSAPNAVSVSSLNP